jgi:hypothetical protein
MMRMNAMQVTMVGDVCTQCQGMIRFVIKSQPYLNATREKIHKDYGNIINNTLKHYELLSTDEYRIQSYIAELFLYNKDHTYVESLENYIEFLKKNMSLFEWAAQWISGSSHEIVQEANLQRLLEILLNRSFTDGYKEFEILTFFNLSDE